MRARLLQPGDSTGSIPVASHMGVFNDQTLALLMRDDDTDQLAVEVWRLEEHNEHAMSTPVCRSGEFTSMGTNSHSPHRAGILVGSENGTIASWDSLRQERASRQRLQAPPTSQQHWLSARQFSVRAPSSAVRAPRRIEYVSEDVFVSDTVVQAYPASSVQVYDWRRESSAPTSSFDASYERPQDKVVRASALAARYGTHQLALAVRNQLSYEILVWDLRNVRVPAMRLALPDGYETVGDRALLYSPDGTELAVALTSPQHGSALLLRLATREYSIAGRVDVPGVLSASSLCYVPHGKHARALFYAHSRLEGRDSFAINYPDMMGPNSEQVLDVSSMQIGDGDGDTVPDVTAVCNLRARSGNNSAVIVAHDNGAIHALDVQHAQDEFWRT